VPSRDKTLLIDKLQIAGININIVQRLAAWLPPKSPKHSARLLESPSGILLRDAGLQMSKGETENENL